MAIRESTPTVSGECSTLMMSCSLIRKLAIAYVIPLAIIAVVFSSVRMSGRAAADCKRAAMLSSLGDASGDVSTRLSTLW